MFNKYNIIKTVVEKLSRMSKRFGPVEGGGHLQVSPEIIPIASRQLPHLRAHDLQVVAVDIF